MVDADLNARSNYLRAVIDLTKHWARAVNHFHAIQRYDAHSPHLPTALDRLCVFAACAELMTVPLSDRAMHVSLVDALRAGVAYFRQIVEYKRDDKLLFLEYERQLMRFSMEFEIVLSSIDRQLHAIARTN